MLDGRQELAVPDRLEELGAHAEQPLAEVLEVAQHALQADLIDAGQVLVPVIHGDLALEFLQHVATDITTAEDRNDVEHAGDGRPAAPLGGLLEVEAELLVQEFEAQEGPHPFAEGLLVEPGSVGRCSLGKQVRRWNANHEWPVSSRSLCFPGILRLPHGEGNCASCGGPRGFGRSPVAVHAPLVCPLRF